MPEKYVESNLNNIRISSKNLLAKTNSLSQTTSTNESTNRHEVSQKEKSNIARTIKKRSEKSSQIQQQKIEEPNRAKELSGADSRKPIKADSRRKKETSKTQERKSPIKFFFKDESTALSTRTSSISIHYKESIELKSDFEDDVPVTHSTPASNRVKTTHLLSKRLKQKLNNTNKFDNGQNKSVNVETENSQNSIEIINRDVNNGDPLSKNGDPLSNNGSNEVKTEVINIDKMSDFDRKKCNKERLSDDPKKSKLLLEFVYGMRGTPKRVQSGKYELPFDFKDDDTISNENKLTDVKKITTLEFNDAYKSFGNFYLSNWLQNYELKRQKMNFRANRAKETHNFILNEQKNRFSACIAKKYADNKAKATISNEKTSIIVENQNFNPENSMNKSKMKFVIQKRAKSVSFAIDKVNSQAIATKGANNFKPIINMKPFYLVSQIEMEEILKEVEDRIDKIKKERKSSSRNKNLSSFSYADIPVVTDSESESEYQFTKSGSMKSRLSQSRYSNSPLRSGDFLNKKKRSNSVISSQITNGSIRNSSPEYYTKTSHR
jgi:hypothetical protein